MILLFLQLFIPPVRAKRSSVSFLRLVLYLKPTVDATRVISRKLEEADGSGARATRENKTRTRADVVPSKKEISPSCNHNSTQARENVGMGL